MEPEESDSDLGFYNIRGKEEPTI